MTTARWNWIPVTLLLTGAGAVATVAAIKWQALGGWLLLLSAGLGMALGAMFWFRRKLCATEQELEAIRAQLHADQDRLERDRQQWEAAQKQFQLDMEQQTAHLEKREQSLAQRFITYHEWTEFPKPVNLAAQPTVSDAQLAELVRKDRELQQLLKDETQRLYDNILANRYVADDQFQADIFFGDARALMTRVAQIYAPNSEHPLLETSLPRIIRGASRACLQMLVVLDELPLNVKDYSVNSMLGYIRRAVQAYRMYKSTEPYWPYANSAYYLGRFAMGTNPLTLGAWWFLGSLGRRGATAIAQHVINRQALAMLSSVVRVVGYEVAGLYGGDFRHRDANWIFAIELTELVSRFPLSRDSLSHALREIGALQLRSEYDRIYLYRCLAGHASALKENYPAEILLTSDERSAIAGRLERFLETFVHGKTTDRAARWKRGVEERLGVKLAAWQPAAASLSEQRAEAVRSLASFVVGVKEREPDELLRLLGDLPLLQQMTHDEQAALFTQLHDQPPYFFEHPDIDPDSPVTTEYLDELADLHAHLAPREAQVEDVITDAAAYLRKDTKYVRSLLDRHFHDALAEHFPTSLSLPRLPRSVMRAALDLLSDSRAKFLYGGVSVVGNGEAAESSNGKTGHWLLGLDDRWILFTAEPQPRVVWRGDEGLQAEVVRGYLTGYCRVLGGRWLADDGRRATELRIAAPLVGSATSYFAPLVEALSAAQSARG